MIETCCRPNIGHSSTNEIKIHCWPVTDHSLQNSTEICQQNTRGDSSPIKIKKSYQSDTECHSLPHKSEIHNL